MPRQPPSRSPSPPSRSPPRAGRKDYKWGGSDFKRTVVASFLGSAVARVVGNAAAAKLFAGRDPETGVMVQQTVADDNPCKKQLDSFVECTKDGKDTSACKGVSDALQKCVDEYPDYFKGKKYT